jgi:hypothetical protein
MGDSEVINLETLNDDDDDNEDSGSRNGDNKQRGAPPSVFEYFNFNHYEPFQVMKSIRENRSVALVVTIVLFLFLFFLVVIGIDAYEVRQRNAIIDDMKIEIDPERIYAQEVVKKAAITIGSFVYSEFLFVFFFGHLFLTTLLCYFTTVYIGEKWRVQRRNS